MGQRDERSAKLCEVPCKSLNTRRPDPIKGELGSQRTVTALRRVGARLAAGTPPGTVRAPLDAYGSTSETTEGHILQRGQCVFTSEPGIKIGLRPPQHQTQVVPVIVPTYPSVLDVVKNDV